MELDGGGIEARHGQPQPQVVERLVTILRKGPQRAGEVIAVDAKAHLHRFAIEPVLKGALVEIARALIEQGRHQKPGASLAARILGGAALKRKIHGDQRHRRFAHQPGDDAARADNAFDRGGPRRDRREAECQKRNKDRERGVPGPALLTKPVREGTGASGQRNGQSVHERSSSECRVFTRYPVTDRRMSSHCFAACCTDSAVTARRRSGQVRIRSAVRPVARPAPYQRANVAWLSWAYTASAMS